MSKRHVIASRQYLSVEQGAIVPVRPCFERPRFESAVGIRAECEQVHAGCAVLRREPRAISQLTTLGDKPRLCVAARLECVWRHPT